MGCETCKCTHPRCCLKTPSGKQFCGVTLALFGLALIGIGMFIPKFIEDTIQDGLRNRYIFKPGMSEDAQKAFNQWKDNTPSGGGPPLSYSVWFYNITNPYGVLEGDKPILEEVGPYVYNEYKVRYDTEFIVDSDTRHTLAYREWEFYRFNREATASHLSEDDVFTSMNLAFQALLATFDTGLHGAATPVVFNLYDSLHPIDRLFTRRPMRELMWGYDDPQFVELADLLKPLGIDFDPYFPGVITNYTKEMSDKLERTVLYTGEGDGEERLLMYWRVYQGQDYLSRPNDLLLANVMNPVWNSTEANRVRGTDATQFHFGIDKDENLEVFIDDIFRSAMLAYDETTTYKDIELFRYRIPDNLMQNQTANPDNAAYWMKFTGMINISVTQKGVPIYMSKPHFLGTTEEVSKMVLGLSKPNPEQHDSFIDVEPITGTTMHAMKRLQINVHVSAFNVSNIFGIDAKEWFKHVDDRIYMPVVWIQEGGSIPDDDADDFKSSIYVGNTIKSATYYGGYIGGNVLVATAILVLFMGISSGKKKNEDDNWHSSSSVGYNPPGYVQPLVNPTDGAYNNMASSNHYVHME